MWNSGFRTTLGLAIVFVAGPLATLAADDGSVRLLVGDQPLTIPVAHIWNQDLRADGIVGSVNLFFLLPDMDPMTPETEAVLTEPGFGPVMLVNLTSLSFGLTVDQRFERGADQNHWSHNDVDLAADGLHPLRGPLSDAGVQNWYALAVDGEVAALVACTDPDTVLYPSCTAHLDLWSRLEMTVNFDADRLESAAEIGDRLVAKLEEFRDAAEGIDL